MGLAGRKKGKIESSKENVAFKKETNTIKYFEQRRNELRDEFNAIKADLQELADYFCPNSVRFLARNVNKPRVKSKKIIDSTPLIALRNFSAGMMTGATAPTRRWFKTSVMNKNIESTWEIKDWCEKQAELTRRILYSSNFYQILPEIYKQLAVFGFSCIGLNSDFDTVVNFQLLPIGSYFYAKNQKGIINTLCRNYTDSARNIVEEFGEENCSQSTIEAAKNHPNQTVEIVHYVELNKQYKKDSPVSEQKKFISVYYEVSSDKNTDNAQDKFLRKKGFDKFPYVVFEASCNGEDTYPKNSIGIEALPDNKQLMTMVKEYAKAVKKMVTPAYKGPASLKNKMPTDAPGHYNVTDENGNGMTPVYEVPPRVLELKQEINEIKESIKAIFYNDLFAMILETADRQRTATEVNELKEEKMILLSPLLEQVHCALRQIHEWIFFEEVRTGIIPEIPEALEGQEIEIEFVSTLAQAMKAQNISSMERFSSFVANMAATLDPIYAKKLNGEKMIDAYADYANIDPSQVTPSEEIEKIRAIAEQKQQQQEQMAALQQGSQLVKNMGGVDAFGADLAARLGVG